MNFDYTDDQQDIKRTAREMLAARVKPERLRELAESGSYDDDTYGEMLSLGWAGIAVPEENGGQGLGMIELSLLQEELGYALAPTPFLSTVAAGLLLTHAGSDAQRERWLPGLVSGEERGAVGVASAKGEALTADAGGSSFLIIVDGDSARLIPTADAGVEPVEVLDSTRQFAAVAADGGEELPGDVGGAMARVAVALAAESVGVAQRTMEMAVAYAKDRKQFGQPIGVHQAVSHRCAQMLLETESARSSVLYAAWTADHEPESLALAAASAKSYASDAGWRVTAAALQVHGGIGFTWEHDLHFFLKRAKVNAGLFGSAREHRERVADLIATTSSDPVPAA